MPTQPPPITIDLRSDTVTRPVPAMYAAMAEAPLGDDVYGDDPTVQRLEALAADQLGFEAALFVASGTQSNLVGLLAHCGRGDEYIVGASYHSRRYEAGGAAALGGVVPESLPVEADGTIALDTIEAAIKPDDVHFARSRVLALENTWHGRLVPQDYMASACALAARHGLRTHLDGARLFNAATAAGRDAAELATPFDTLSICLSKGLCAPAGSVLLGPRDFIEDARRWRKMVGGGLRQAGILAACGIVSLEVMTRRLGDDHATAATLAELLDPIDEVTVNQAAVQTNMVFMDAADGETLAAAMRAEGIAISGPGPTIRLVTHNDVSMDDVAHVAASVAAFYGASAAASAA